MEQLTRRHLIKTGLAGTAAIAATALPAIAVASNADAKLLQLCRNWQRIERAYARACAIHDDAEQEHWAKEKQRKQKPRLPRPEVLTGELDVWPEACGPFGLVDLAGENVRETLSKVAEGSWTMFACFLPGGDRKSMKGVAPPEAARSKARELLAIYDDWAANGGGEPKPARRRRSTALVKADRALERLSRLQEKTANAVADIPAQTVAGIKAKLAIVAGDSDAPDGVDQFGTSYEPLRAALNSALRDIHRIDLSARLTPPAAA